MRARHLLVPLLAAAPLVTSCTTPHLAVDLRAQYLPLDGQIGAGSGSVSGTTTTEELGLTEEPVVFAPRADLRLGPVNIEVDGFSTEYSGTGDVSSAFMLGGITLLPGQTMETTIGLDMAKAVATWDFIPGDMLELGLGVGVAGTRANGTFVAGGVTETGEALVPIPLVAVKGGGKFSIFSVDVLAAGMQFTYEGDDVTFFDLDAGAKIRIISPTGGKHLSAHLELGYRHVVYDVNFEDDGDRLEADLTLAGPYVGLTIIL